MESKLIDLVEKIESIIPSAKFFPLNLKINTLKFRSQFLNKK